MPTRPPMHRPPRPPVPRDYAAEHLARQANPTQVAAGRVRRSRRWQRLRLRVLGRQPLCADPYGWHQRDGQSVLSTDVDHRVGLAQRPDLAFDEANLQGLCRACHAHKSGEERRRAPVSPYGAGPVSPYGAGPVSQDGAGPGSSPGQAVGGST
jgi:5-methylcytosine-specific restriction protein A